MCSFTSQQLQGRDTVQDLMFTGQLEWVETHSKFIFGQLTVASLSTTSLSVLPSGPGKATKWDKLAGLSLSQTVVATESPPQLYHAVWLYMAWSHGHGNFLSAICRLDTLRKSLSDKVLTGGSIEALGPLLSPSFSVVPAAGLGSLCSYTITHVVVKLCSYYFAS